MRGFLPKGFVARVLGLENVVELFELVTTNNVSTNQSLSGRGKTDRKAPRFRDQKIHHHCLEEAPEHQDDVRFPANTRECGGPGELVQQTRSVDNEPRESEAFGPHFKGEHFDRVQHDHGCQAEREDYLEHVYQRQDRPCRIDRPGPEVYGGCYGHAEPHETQGDVGEEEEGSTADAVHEERAGHGHDEL